MFSLLPKKYTCVFVFVYLIFQLYSYHVKLYIYILKSENISMMMCKIPRLTGHVSAYVKCFPRSCEQAKYLND